MSNTIRLLFVAVALAACAPASDPDTAASPVVSVSRRAEGLAGETGMSYEQRGADGTVVGRMVAPAPAVWDALLAAFTARKVTPAILDRSLGRVGDTLLSMMYQWNGRPLSRYLSCGATMTGARAE